VKIEHGSSSAGTSDGFTRISLDAALLFDSIERIRSWISSPRLRKLESVKLCQWILMVHNAIVSRTNLKSIRY
jgi:hypothetical protein